MKKWQEIFLGVCVAIAMVNTAQAAEDATTPKKIEEATVPKKPVSQWTCQEFLEIRDSFKPQVMYWAEALNKKGKPDDAWIDVRGTETVIPVIVETCKAQPNSSFWTKVKASWERVKNKMYSKVLIN